MNQTEALIAQLATEGPRKTWPHPLKITLWWLAAIACYAAVFLWIDGIRPDLPDRWKNPAFLTDLLLVMAMGITSLVAASWLALPDVNQQPWVRLLPFIPLLLLGGILGYGVATDAATTLIECALSKRFDCVLHLIAVSLLPVALLIVTLRKAAPLHTHWAGGMALLAGTSFSYLLLRLVEAEDDPYHLLMWHFTPALLIMGLGMLLGHALLTWHRTTRKTAF